MGKFTGPNTRQFEVENQIPAGYRGYGMPGNGKSTNRRWDRGSNACGNCQSHHHKNCRPKLDGSLCSCSCPRSQEIRDEVEAQNMIADRAGAGRPSIKEAVKFVCPKFNPVFSLENKQRDTQ